MLLYLRIVHSVDFYNHSEYVNEDEMPNRCGIMHARCAPPSNPVCILFIRLVQDLAFINKTNLKKKMFSLPNKK